MKVDLARAVRRGAGAAPGPRQRVVRPHGAPAAPGAGRRGQGPRRGASGAPRDPRDRSRPAAPAPRDLGAATPPAGWMRRRRWRCSTTPARRSGPGASACWWTTAGRRPRSIGRLDGDGERGLRARRRRAERSPLVRLYLASAMQRIPVETRWPIAEALAIDGASASRQSHAADLVRPGAAGARATAVARPPLLARCPSPTLCRFIARRMVAADVDARAGGAGAGAPIAAGVVSVIPPRGARRHPGGGPGPEARADAGGLAGCSRGNWPTAATRTSAPRPPRWGCSSATRGPSRACARSSRTDRRRPAPGGSPCQNLVDRRTAGLAPAAFPPAG